MKLLQLNTTVNSGSTGRIAEDIGLTIMAAGHLSYIAAGIANRPSQSRVMPIGSKWDRNLHGVKTRLFDGHGFGSVYSTRHLLKSINDINPDIIHLHNIHGYYLNIEILFRYLKEIQKPIVWTFHDCWPFTGHCSYFDAVGCFKWKTECNHCPNKKGYPASICLDRSKVNYYRKNAIFNSINKLQIVTPSLWLANHVQQSFLSNYPVQVIHNGTDLNNFKCLNRITETKARCNLSGKKIILGVASIWDARKGLQDFIQLSKSVKPDEQIVLVGLDKKMISWLPNNISGIERTENIAELAELYNASEVFVNPTYADNFPTTNIEALACGTPVVTYNTGGSPEAVDEMTGFVVEKGNVPALAIAIQQVIKKGKSYYESICRERAMKLFNKNERYKDYLKLYEKVISEGETMQKSQIV
jgi:glycosyltransferase involved in cell wall biosynthesis